MDMKEGNLSPSVLAKNTGTTFFAWYPLRGEVSGSVPDFISIQLRSVAFYHSTVLNCEGEASESVPHFRPILLRKSFFIIIF